MTTCDRLLSAVLAMHMQTFISSRATTFLLYRYCTWVVCVTVKCWYVYLEDVWAAQQAASLIQRRQASTLALRLAKSQNHPRGMLTSMRCTPHSIHFTAALMDTVSCALDFSFRCHSLASWHSR